MGAGLLHDYAALASECRGLTANETSQKLGGILAAIWADDYVQTCPPNPEILTIAFGSTDLSKPFCRYMFHQSSADPRAETAIDDRCEDRVVAVWGRSGGEPASSRDKSRAGGFLRRVWSRRFPNNDRGHFFAHTMGGGLDINLFPQDSRLNRGGLWRRMEHYCATHPGTFCFIRPIYRDADWRPHLLEYGIFKMRGDSDLEFWGHVFEN